jgi:cysteine desulfurase
VKLELTRRGDYAVRAMLALAAADAADPAGTPVSARRIAERMAIPGRFVPHVLADLVAAGLVSARTGRAGGYRLARPAAEISLLDVITAVEGDARRRGCVLRGVPCGTDGFCAVHPVFMAAQDAILDHLARATLADVPLAPLEPLGST